MVKIASIFTFITLILGTGTAFAADTAIDPSPEDCESQLIYKVGDRNALVDGINTLRDITGNEEISLATLFESVDGKATFQLIQNNQGDLLLNTKDHGAFDANFCSSRSGIIAVIKVTNIFHKARLGADQVVFEIKGTKNGQLLITSDNDYFGDTKFNAVN